MSLYEFLERMDADPFDPALTALFLGKDTEPAQQTRSREDELMKRLDNLDGCEDNPVYAAEIREIRRELQRIRNA